MCEQLPRLIQQGNPGIGVARGLDEDTASLSEQPFTVLFPGDKLVHIADGSEGQCQVLYLYLCLLCFGYSGQLFGHRID